MDMDGKRRSGIEGRWDLGGVAWGWKDIFDFALTQGRNSLRNEGKVHRR
jgi:hypothetical protein